MKKEMLINVLQPEECRIAIVEDGILEELYVERTSLESYTGNIYKGKVVNLEPAIQAAFVDFSVGRNGFLHVSDVEPQYYQRHLAADAETGPRDREPRREPRRDRPRPEDRGDAGPPPPRDRPDRSERGRRDRSEPRRFGEGLVGDDEPAPPRPQAAPQPPPTPAPSPRRDAEPARDEAQAPRERERGRDRDRDEPRRPRAEPSGSMWAEEPPAVREREREPRGVEPEGPRGRGFGGAEPFDPDLPPSRTQRPRPVPPAPRLPEFHEEEAGRSRLDAPPPFGPEPETGPTPVREPEREREPRRGRGRGRPVRPSPEPAFGPGPEPEVEPEVEPELSVPEAEPEPEPDDGAGPPRRGGRAAIRSRGGDREMEPERPRHRDRPAIDRDRPAPDRPARERPAVERPAPERERPVVERPAFERPTFERPAVERPTFERPAVEPEPERPRGVERGRVSEPEPPRDRAKPHARAGEPGYVPRRERVRGVDAGFGPDPLDWPEPGTEAEPEGEGELVAEGEVDDLGPGSAKDGTRRRRRRRGRRRERERPASEPAGVSAGDETDLDDDEPEPPRGAAAAAVTPPPAARREPEPLKRAPRPSDDEDALDREFDFGDEADEGAGRFDHDEADDDLRDRDRDEIGGEPGDRLAPEDDTIDPGLEEEIRREIEEIAELEREMGLRGTTEARPRRGDDREAGPGSGAGPGRFPRGRGLSKPGIQEIFRRGDEVLVQVIKESIGTKGPTLSTYISIPGRYLVLMPGLNRVGVSRKIADEGQRRKLRDIMNDLNPPKGLGFIVRTAGLERTKRELARDLAYLLRLWKVILRRIKKSRGPTPIYQESDMITRTIRDIFTSEIDTIWIDETQAFERAQEFLRVVMPKFVDRLKLYEERVPLFHKYGIEDEIAKIQRRHVPLPEGGSIVIDQTEALVAIDVNSGNFRVENDAERTAYEMNLRAAKEIARQLRLRDLGGVIVNDFIDMRDEKHRRGVEKSLRDAIKRDRARTKVLRMSAFGLIEMTRQRIRPSLKRSVYEDCPHCTGAGVVKTVESMSIDVMRLLALASHREDIRRVHVTVAPGVAAHLNNRKRRDIARLETDNNMVIHVRAEEGAPAEHLQIECFDAHNGEIRLLPAPPPPPGHRRPHGR